jgi:hypothetical protein
MTKMKTGSGGKKPMHGAQHTVKVKAAGGMIKTPAKSVKVVAASKPKAKEFTPDERARKYAASKKK